MAPDERSAIPTVTPVCSGNKGAPSQTLAHRPLERRGDRAVPEKPAWASQSWIACRLKPSSLDRIEYVSCGLLQARTVARRGCFALEHAVSSV